MGFKDGAIAEAAGNVTLMAQLDQKIALTKTAQAAELAQYEQHAQDIVATMQKQVADIAAQGKDAGESFVQGIIEGMSAGAGALGNAMADAVMAAVDAVKRALGIASPSKLFAVEIGQPIAEGMAIGVQAKAMLLSDATAKAAQGSLAAASSSITNYNLNANYKTQSEGSLRDGIVMLSMLKGRK